MSSPRPTSKTVADSVGAASNAAGNLLGKYGVAILTLAAAMAVAHYSMECYKTHSKNTDRAGNRALKKEKQDAKKAEQDADRALKKAEQDAKEVEQDANRALKKAEQDAKKVEQDANRDWTAGENSKDRALKRKEFKDEDEDEDLAELEAGRM